MPDTLQAGASVVDWTPSGLFHLAGYPHIQRESTGTHDPLLASALCLSDGQRLVAMVAVDVVFITHDMARRVRRRVEAELGIPAADVLIAATHTHSGPKTTHYVVDGDEPNIPATDDAIVARCEEAVAEAIRVARDTMTPAEAGLVMADASGVGGNRRDPAGPTNPEVPLLALRRASDQQPIGAVVVYGMHPTVMHGDSTLISSDFPGFTRQYLQRHWLGEQTPVLYFTGPAGDQSPRHVTRANTFDEARRLGEMLGDRLLAASKNLTWRRDLTVSRASTHVRLTPRDLPSVDEAAQRVKDAADRLDRLRRDQAPRPETRTAEVDWFGARRTLGLAKAAAEGRTQAAIARRSPTEIQAIMVGPWTFVAWPGEVFVAFALAIKAQHSDVHLIAYANGENEGYLVTREAVEAGAYEATNALFQSPESGEALVAATNELLGRLNADRREPQAGGSG